MFTSNIILILNIPKIMLCFMSEYVLSSCAKSAKRLLNKSLSGQQGSF